MAEENRSTQTRNALCRTLVDIVDLHAACLQRLPGGLSVGALNSDTHATVRAEMAQACII